MPQEMLQYFTTRFASTLVVLPNLIVRCSGIWGKQMVANMQQSWLLLWIESAHDLASLLSVLADLVLQKVCVRPDTQMLAAALLSSLAELFLCRWLGSFVRKAPASSVHGFEESSTTNPFLIAQTLLHFLLLYKQRRGEASLLSGMLS